MNQPAQSEPAKKPKFGLSLFALLFMAGLAAWWFTAAPRPRFFLTACLQDARSLQQGAPVKIAGVNVGFVRKLRAQPQDASCPALAEMAFTATYKLEIPRDSFVMTATEGVLGQTYLLIVTSHARAPFITDGGRLATAPAINGNPSGPRIGSAPKPEK